MLPGPLPGPGEELGISGIAGVHPMLPAVVVSRHAATGSLAHRWRVATDSSTAACDCHLASLPTGAQDKMELSQGQRQSILTAWHSYQDAVGAARQQTHQSIDVLRGQAEQWARQEEQQAGGAYGGPAQAAAEVRARTARIPKCRQLLAALHSHASS